MLPCADIAIHATQDMMWIPLTVTAAATLLGAFGTFIGVIVALFVSASRKAKEAVLVAKDATNKATEAKQQATESKQQSQHAHGVIDDRLIAAIEEAAAYKATLKEQAAQRERERAVTKDIADGKGGDRRVHAQITRNAASQIMEEATQRALGLIEEAKTTAEKLLETATITAKDVKITTGAVIIQDSNINAANKSSES